VNKVVLTYVSTLVGLLSKLVQSVRGFAQDEFGDLCLNSHLNLKDTSDQALVAMLSVFQSV